MSVHVHSHVLKNKNPSFKKFSMHVAVSSSDHNAIRYVLPVLYMTSCFHVIKRMGENQRRRVCFVEFARVAAPGVKSDVSD